MNQLSNIENESILLAKDFAGIIRWFSNKLQYTTKKWTDLSISEPDTLSLSYIAYIFDMINYLIDNKYINSQVRYTNSVSVMSYYYRLTGSELLDYESSLIKVSFDNKSDDSVTVNKLDIFRMKNHPDELFTSTDDYLIPRKSSVEIELVRGVPRFKIYTLNDLVNGRVVLDEDRVNRNLIIVTLNGSVELNRVEDAVFDEGLSFSVSQYSEYLTAITLSPLTVRSLKSNIIVKYIINDSFPLKENSELLMLKDPSDSYSILSVTTNDLQDISMDDMKLIYYKNLSEVLTAFNDLFDIDQLMTGRIDYIRFKYNTTNLFKSATIDYDEATLILTGNITSDAYARIKYKYYQNDTEYSYEDILRVTNYNQGFNLYVPFGYRIKPKTFMITLDDKYIAADLDGEGELVNIKGVTKIDIPYSTIDDNPITNMLNQGIVSYTGNYIQMELNYIPTDELLITYNYESDDTEKHSEILSVSITSNIANIMLNHSVIPNSLVIKDIYGNVIKDDGEGNLYNYSSEASILLNKISSKLLMNEEPEDVNFIKVSIIYINIVAHVYLYTSEVSTNDILEDITNALKMTYNKTTYKEGDYIRTSAITSVIKNSNSAIESVIVVRPGNDFLLNTNQVVEIGTINIVFERSDEF